MRKANLILFSSIVFIMTGCAQASLRMPASETIRLPALLTVDEADPRVETEKLTLSELQRQARLQHAHELLGRHYKRSAVKSGERVSKINKQIYRWTAELLPKKSRTKYKKVAQTIIDEALKHEFDPVFLMSVIQGESSFNPRMLGKLDEIGLMQLRPATAKWVADRYGLKYDGRKSLFDPVTNIRLGAAFLSYLRDRFDSHAQLYIAAYNMGQGNVKSALSRNVWPKDYPTHVMRRYVDFYASLDRKS